METRLLSVAFINKMKPFKGDFPEWKGKKQGINTYAYDGEIEAYMYTYMNEHSYVYRIKGKP